MSAAPLFLLLALQAQDPVQVGARLTEEEVPAGETTTLRVDVETEGARARIRPFRTLPAGIEVVSTRDYDQRQFSLPGGTRRFITREFVLRAERVGRYRIPSIEVVVDGAVYATRSQLLTVTSARGGSEAPGSDDGVVLRAWLDADTVYVGEQVTLEVEALFSPDARMRLRRAPEYEAPSPSGVWTHELPDPSRRVDRSFGDETWEAQRFRQAFFALAPGDYTIPSARLEYELRRGLLYAPETREVTSDPLALVVRPIPAGRPPGFTGAVGDYALDGGLEPTTVPVGEAAVLSLVVEGTGNVKALPSPELPELPDIDVFPPSEEAVTDVRGTVIRGSKTFSWVLVPRRAGDVEVPRIHYAFFDPETGGFETASMGPLSLRVTPVGTEADPPAATIRFPRMAPETDPLAWVRSSWFAALQALPLLLLATALVWRYRQDRKSRLSPGSLRRDRRRTLRELARRADQIEDADLFTDAESFARRWLRQRLGSAGPAVTDLDALVAVGVSEDTAAATRTVLARLSAARYAPTPPGAPGRRAVIRELGRVLEAVDRTAQRRSAEPATSSVGVLLVMAGAVMASPAAVRGQGGQIGGDDTARSPQTPSTPDLFDRGLVAFEDGEYAAAATSFATYVRRAPRDPAGWYNLGTAHYRAGRPGHGVWAWLHAVRLDPRDEDARHNLRATGAPPELVQRVTPTVPLRGSELLLLATLAWLMAGTLGAAWLVRRDRSLGVVALAGLAVALTLAAVWWGSTRSPETLVVLDGTTLRSGPTLRAEPVAALEPGVGLVRIESYGDWLRARTLRGEEGWIQSDRTGRF